MMDLFGATLLTKDGEKPTAEVLEGKVVLIYFSAHWCPPCRGFTPKLAEWYKTDLRAKGLEVVFVSSDKSEDQFKSYFEEMPWVALPFSDRERKAALSKKFKVSGIPALIVLDTDGSVITTEGRAAVSKDPTGENFPWRPKSLSELLNTTFIGKQGDVSVSELEGKVIGLYFSAHWCPPCRGFTPKLAEVYNAAKAKGLPFEIIFASSDRDEGSFKEYFDSMPWLAIPYADRARKEELSERFGVNGIPSFVLLDTDRSVITTEGRGAVGRDLSEFPWYPKPVADLAVGCDDINEVMSFTVLMEKSTAEKKAEVLAVLEPVAKEFLEAAKAKGEDPEVKFFISSEEGGVSSQIRKLTNLGSPSEEPAIVVLDIPDNGGFYVPKGELTEAGVRKMLEEVKTKVWSRQQLS